MREEREKKKEATRGGGGGGALLYGVNEIIHNKSILEIKC